MSTGETLTIAGSVVSVLFGMIGLAAAYYFYRKSVREKAPCWSIRSYNIIHGYRSAMTDVAVLYRGEAVDNVTVSKVVFWNQGAIPIDRQDIETKNQLRVVTVGETRLLDARVISQNNASSHVSVTVSTADNCAYITFDYLDRNTGAVIQVVHNGTSSDNITVTGDIKGTRITKVSIDKPAPFWNLFRELHITFISGIILVIAINAINVASNITKIQFNDVIFIMVLFLLLSLLTFLPSRLESILSVKVPAGLDDVI